MKEDPVYQVWHLALDMCIVNDASKNAGSHWLLRDPYLLGILHALCPVPKPSSVMPFAPGAWLVSKSYLPGSLAFSFQVGSAQEISGQQGIYHPVSLPVELCSQEWLGLLSGYSL